MPTAIGIVGTGELGARMGRRLRTAGHRVSGFDINGDALQAAAAMGIEPCPSARDLAQRCGLVITCVTDGIALRESILGADGLAEALPPGATIIDTTSAEPWITDEIAGRLARRGIGFLDAPVSGGIPAAEAGTLNFMIGGEAMLLQRWLPVLRTLGSRVAHVGPIGSGHKVKAINMIAMAGCFLATGEILAGGRAAGLDISGMLDAINEGPAGSFVTRVHYPRYVVPRTYDSAFAFNLMLKDLGIGLELARRVGVPAFLANRVLDVYRIAASRGYRGADNTRVANLLLPPGGQDCPKGAYQPRDQSLAGTKTALISLLQATNLLVAGDTVLIGIAAGLDPVTTIDVLSAGSGHSNVLNTLYRDQVIGRTFSSGTKLGELRNSVAVANETIARAGVPAFLTSTAAQIYSAALCELGMTADATEVVKALELWYGLNPAPDGAGCDRYPET